MGDTEPKSTEQKFVDGLVKANAAVRETSNLSTAALRIPVSTGLLCLVGYGLDWKFGWKPWGMVVGALLGASAGMYGFLKEALRKPGP